MSGRRVDGDTPRDRRVATGGDRGDGVTSGGGGPARGRRDRPAVVVHGADGDTGGDLPARDVASNLPHGGYGHFANLRRCVRRFRWRYVAGYAAIIAVAVGLFLVAPVAGLAVAIAVTIAKSGGGDLYVLEVTAGTGHLRTRTQRPVAVAAR